MDNIINRAECKSLVSLINRSPDTGDGWRNVSSLLMTLVVDFEDQSLIEWEYTDTGGKVRLSPKGVEVAPYL
jgi:hypothetical protein